MVLAAVGLLLAIHGCKRPAAVDTVEVPPPFAFRSLDLEQRTKKGQPAWSLKSPEARYNLQSSVARAMRPEGVIFAKGQPLYRLGATTGTVINDGAVILLEGSIRLQRLGRDPLMILAERALWIPGEEVMRFDVAPMVRNPLNQLSSQSATLHLDRDLLELRGQPRLVRWSQPRPLNGPSSPGRVELVGTLTAVDWHPGTGDLKGQGPVTLRRRPPRGDPKAPLQLLKASRLEGNTLQQRYTLQGPVQVEDPAERGWFRGGALTIDAKERWLTSAPPFEAQRGALRLRGEELRLDGQRTTASVARHCQLQQQDSGLQSQRCQWNWTTQAVEAEGDVVFSRPASGQLTRAQRIQGRLGPQGQVVASTPGGRVVTRVRVPGRVGPPSPPRVPAKPAPIAF
ncbi:MAG: LPS export ABC transporter periplasmic protein LptC [Cyanobacteriota bacterium]|nr:LPS export ABC transporter periplasmic protein LptC [Cyanobacteriota bacterium]